MNYILEEKEQNGKMEKTTALNREMDIAKMGRRIMAMRLANGLTRAELAEKIDKSNQTLASIEYGNKGMSLKTLHSICEALEVTPNYILGWSKYPVEGNEEYSQVCEEVTEMLKACNSSQMRTLSGIVKLYVDEIRKIK